MVAGAGDHGLQILSEVMIERDRGVTCGNVCAEGKHTYTHLGGLACTAEFSDAVIAAMK